MTHFDPITISAFKAYDVRGELDKNLDKTIAYRIARATAQFLLTESPTDTPAIVIGADIRPSSHALKLSAIQGIQDAGVNVIDLGMTGTEEVYFATTHLGAIGGIEITASHNPINYNGMKFVKSHSRPLGADTGLGDIQKIAESGQFNDTAKGTCQSHHDKSAYIAHLLSYINKDNLKPLKIVVNCGNGSAGPVVDLLEQALKDKLQFIKIHHTPDGTFPNGIPNPMIVANRTATAQAVVENGADMGIAFDGDFDRCFFFDETGRFLDGTYLVGVLAKAFLSKHQGATIVYDPRNLFATEAVIADNDGVAKVSKSGHSYIKATMRETGAVYGGEMSAHHYFKDFNYCDSGMIPWLLVAELLSLGGQKLSALVDEMMDNFPISGEINFRLTQLSAGEILAQFEQNFANFDQNGKINKLDGLSVDYANWRFNVRASNTEPLVRLNVETKGDKALLQAKTAQLCAFIGSFGATLADS